MKDGFINLLKPPGMTSHDAINYVRRTLGVKKAGHAGTLDPGASGVLPVATGRATRLLSYVGDAGKSYRAELLFGIETDSGDDLGEVTESLSDFSMPDEAALLAAARSLTGRMMQMPPVYSAVKIDGRRAADIARRGGSVNVPPREVTVYRLEVLSRGEKTLLIDVDCSKGTYIRSLCRDLGRLVNIPACMSFLVRTRVGGFHIGEAVTPEELLSLGEGAVMMPDGFLSHMPCVELPERRIRPFLSGLPTRMESVPSGSVRVISGGRLLGIGEYDEASSSLITKLSYEPPGRYDS